VLLLRARRAPTRRSEVVLGWSAVAAGLGSVAYHGPGGTLGRYVHDAGLLSMLSMVVVADTEIAIGRTAPGPMLAAVPAVAALVAHPTTSQVAQAVVGGGVVAAETVRLTRGGGGGQRGVLEAVVTSVAGAAHLLGRTGGPLCRPDSVFQSHALWHVATALVIGRRVVDR
jgi:hypothetical protein